MSSSLAAATMAAPDLLSELERSVVTGKLDTGTALWQAASSGSVETLELVLQLPEGWGIILNTCGELAENAIALSSPSTLSIKTSAELLATRTEVLH